MSATTTVNDSGMRNSLAVSAVFHILLLILLYFGLPTLFKPLPVHHDPIPFEIVDIADITNTRVDKPEPPQPPAPPPKPAPRAQTATPAPPKTEPMPEALNVPKPQEKPKQIEKPKPDPLASVLKNVEKLKSAEQSKTKTQDTSQKQQEVKSVAPTLSNRLTMTEEDALRRQVEQCWNFNPGARGAENLIVEVIIAVNPDRTVARADVVDTARMASDPFFRSAAEAAVRALFAPKCTPLALPPDKYEQWKVIDFTFDPRDML